MRISDWSSDVCSSDLKRFIFALGPVRYRASSAVHDRNHGLDGWKTGKQRIDYREEVAMDEKNLGVRLLQGVGDKSGSASCRERVCQYEEISVVAVKLKKQNTIGSNLPLTKHKI